MSGRKGEATALIKKRRKVTRRVMRVLNSMAMYPKS